MHKITEINLNFTNSSPTPPITPGLRRSRWAMPVMPNVFSLFLVSDYKKSVSLTPKLYTLNYSYDRGNLLTEFDLNIFRRLYEN